MFVSFDKHEPRPLDKSPAALAAWESQGENTQGFGYSVYFESMNGWGWFPPWFTFQAD